jgi:hypothetical protein
LPDRDAKRAPRLAIDGANCLGAPDSYSCFALVGASVTAYHPRQADRGQVWSGALAVVREQCTRDERARARTGACAEQARSP